MGESRRRTVPAYVRVWAALAAGWAAWGWGLSLIFWRFDWFWWAVGLTIGRLLIEGTVLLLLIAASTAVVLGALGRTVARARVRAGYADPLDSLRAWTSRHARATRAAVWAPAASWFAFVSSLFIASYPSLPNGWASVALFSGLIAPIALGAGLVTREALRALLAPTLGREEEASERGVGIDQRLGFDAVAVTAETRAAVAAVALLPVLTVLGIGAAHLRDAATLDAFGVYIAVAVASVAVFRRASRIAVGVDGVYVTGSSRTRFFAYKDIDRADARKGDLVLERQGKVVLRLQLHGKDAVCRDALLERLQAAVRAAHEGAGAGAGEVVASVSSSELARAAAGASGYRSPAVTRDQLWSVVEGTEHDAAIRTAAARALATTRGTEEHGRLRVAAERCAEPRLRVDLLELAEEAEDGIAPSSLNAARLAR